MKVKMYVVQASHPCWAVKRALEGKGIDYKRVELPVTMHVPLQRLRFPQGTVPGIKIEGEKVIGSRAIMHRLDELRPDPPLYPSDPEARARVEEADRWGEENFQALARRIAWWTLRANPHAGISYGDDSSLPLPDFAVRGLTPLISRIEWRINDVSDETVARDLRELPADLDRIDGWIADGTVEVDPPNAPALQIGSSIALLNTVADVRPLLAGRPALELAQRHFADFPGDVPEGVLPTEWMPAATAA